MNQKRCLRTILCLFLIALLALTAAACGSDDDATDSNLVPYEVDGTSMEPTLMDKQTVKYAPFDGSMPSPGDIILFSRAEGYKAPLVKRVIAVAGQELRLDYEKNKIYVDGKLLDERGYTQGTLREGDIPADELNGVIPEGKVFVLGDNRTISLDSRFSEIGMVDVSNIIGTIIVPNKQLKNGMKTRP